MGRWIAVSKNTRGYEIVQRAIVIAILFQVRLLLWAMADICWGGYEHRYRYGYEYGYGYEYEYEYEYSYGDDCLIAHIRQMVCYCFY